MLVAQNILQCSKVLFLIHPGDIEDSLLRIVQHLSRICLLPVAFVDDIGRYLDQPSQNSILFYDFRICRCVRRRGRHSSETCYIGSSSHHFKGLAFFQLLADGEHIHRRGSPIEISYGSKNFFMYFAVKILRRKNFQNVKQSFFIFHHSSEHGTFRVIAVRRDSLFHFFLLRLRFCILRNFSKYPPDKITGGNFDPLPCLIRRLPP